MKKKAVLLTSSVAAVGLAIGALTLSGSLGALELSAGSGVSKTHTFSFEISDLTPGDYNSDCYAYPLSFYEENAIQDSSGNYYEIKSVDFDPVMFGGSYIYCGEDEPTFGGSQFISFVGNYQSFNFEFSLINRATVDYDKSVVSLTVDGEYENVKINPDYNDVGDERTTYSFYAEFYSNYYYEKTIKITEVKLVFSCIQQFNLGFA